MVNRFLLVDSSEFPPERTGRTYMSSGFTASLVRQDTSSDKNANGQALRPHTGLNDLPEPTNQSEVSKRIQDFKHLLRRRLVSIPHNNGSSHTHTRSPTSQNQRILMLNRPIANLLLCRKRLPSFPFRVLLFVKEVLSGACPE